MKPKNEDEVNSALIMIEQVLNNIIHVQETNFALIMNRIQNIEEILNIEQMH